MNTKSIVTSRPEDASNSDLIRAICRAFEKTSDFEEATLCTVRLARAAVGVEKSEVKVFLPDQAGRLLPVAPGERPQTQPAPRGLEADEVWNSFQTKSTLKRGLPDPQGWSVGVLPFVTRDEAVGVMEVTAPERDLDKAWERLEVVANEAAAAFSRVEPLSPTAPTPEALGSATGLARRLMGAGSAREALRAVLAYCYESFHLPMAAWILDEERDRLVLTGVRGLGAGRRQDLRRRVKEIPPWERLSRTARERTRRTFSSVVGVGGTTAIETADALLLVGGASRSVRESLENVHRLLDETMSRFRDGSVPERRELEVGIAVTAHELRGPLLGAKAAVEHIAGKPDDTPADRTVLRRVGRELEQLAELVDLLLGWAVGSESVELKKTDLVSVVREAVMACRHEGSHRVRLSTPRSLEVKADPRHIRGAIANVVVNALVYSPPDKEVELEVKGGRKWAIVRVVDRGRGIPKEERSLIFDPFFRGAAAASQGRAGGGLGLFVANKVIQAHGGTITVTSSGNGSGSTFELKLPLAGVR
jgi:signal transduction histidine kinase